MKYHGPVALDAFACTPVSDGSDIARICHDRAERYMVIQLGRTYYHYCGLDAPAVQAFLATSAKRQFFETRIRGTGKDGPFDCRTHPIPRKYR